MNGYLADSKDEWIESIIKIRDNSTKAKQMGSEGRRKVEQQYCLQVTAPQLVSWFKEVAA